MELVSLQRSCGSPMTASTTTSRSVRGSRTVHHARHSVHHHLPTPALRQSASLSFLLCRLPPRLSGPNGHSESTGGRAATLATTQLHTRDRPRPRSGLAVGQRPKWRGFREARLCETGQQSPGWSNDEECEARARARPSSISVLRRCTTGQLHVHRYRHS